MHMYLANMSRLDEHYSSMKLRFVITLCLTLATSSSQTKFHISSFTEDNNYCCINDSIESMKNQSRNSCSLSVTYDPRFMRLIIDSCTGVSHDRYLNGVANIPRPYDSAIAIITFNLRLFTGVHLQYMFSRCASWEATQ
jgi:hypothetical protein